MKKMRVMTCLLGCLFLSSLSFPAGSNTGEILESIEVIDELARIIKESGRAISPEESKRCYSKATSLISSLFTLVKEDPKAYAKLDRRFIAKVLQYEPRRPLSIDSGLRYKEATFSVQLETLEPKDRLGILNFVITRILQLRPPVAGEPQRGKQTRCIEVFTERVQDHYTIVAFTDEESSERLGNHFLPGLVFSSPDAIKQIQGAESNPIIVLTAFTLFLHGHDLYAADNEFQRLQKIQKVYEKRTPEQHLEYLTALGLNHKLTEFFWHGLTGSIEDEGSFLERYRALID